MFARVDVGAMARQAKSVVLAHGGVNVVVVGHGVDAGLLPDWASLASCPPREEVGAATMARIGMEAAPSPLTIVALEWARFIRSDAALMARPAVLLSRNSLSRAAHVKATCVDGRVVGLAHGEGRSWGGAFGLDAAFRKFYLEHAGPRLMAHEPIARYVAAGGEVDAIVPVPPRPPRRTFD